MSTLTNSEQTLTSQLLTKIKNINCVGYIVERIRVARAFTIKDGEELMSVLYANDLYEESMLARQWVLAQKNKLTLTSITDTTFRLFAKRMSGDVTRLLGSNMLYVAPKDGVDSVMLTEGEARFAMFLLELNNHSFTNKTNLVSFTQEQADKFRELRFKLRFVASEQKFRLRTMYETKSVPKTLGMHYVSAYRYWEAEAYQIDWLNSNEINQVYSDDCDEELERMSLQKSYRNVFSKARFGAARIGCLDTLDGLVDKEHQLDSLEFLVEKAGEAPGAILQLEMGLGKTRIALRFAQLWKSTHKAHQIVVICPAAIVTQWYRTAMGFPLSIQVYSWSNIPSSVSGDYILIVDESHKSKNMSAKQTQSVLKLAHYSSFNLCLTGTASPNGKPAELIAQLRMCGVSETYDVKGFTSRYMYPEQLSKLLSEHVYTLKVSDVYNQSRPNINYTRHSLTVEQESVLDDMFSDIMEKFYEKVEQGQASIYGKSFVQLTASRVANSMAKIDTTIQRINEVIETSPVVVFLDFAVSAQQLYTALTGRRADDAIPDDEIEAGSVVLGNGQHPHQFALVLGNAYRKLDPTKVTYYSAALNSKQRDAALDEFRQGKTDVFIATYGTGGTGIDGLQNRKPVVILHDLSWVPGTVSQAIYRVHRLRNDGEFNVATVEAILGHRVDQLVYDTLIEKTFNIEEMGL